MFCVLCGITLFFLQKQQNKTSKQNKTKKESKEE
jgi:preprotein translocase subunit YajC